MQLSNKQALTSKVYDIADFAAAQELFHSNGWTDGLPVVPPTEEAVEACLEWALMPPDQLIGIEPVREQPITAEKLAINAVMAGCLPMHFPVVATAWSAMMQEEFLLHGTTSSTGGCAVLVIINGPVRLEIGANGTFNALANSDRATAVIGRALRRGRRGHNLAAARADARHTGAHIRRDRDGRDGAAPDHERVDHRPERNSGDLRRRDARKPAPLFDLWRQLCNRDPKTIARAHPGRGLDQARHRRIRL
jgi:hypothetical protein